MITNTPLLLACSLLIACGQAQGTEHRPEGLIYCAEGAPHTFNPQLTNQGTTLDAVSYPLYDRLLELNPITLALEPALATEWSVSEDGLRYRFTLRKGVMFHASPEFVPTRPLNADDVIFSFARVLDPRHPYYHVSGGRYPFFKNLGLDRLIKGVHKRSERVVEFELERPNAAFLADLASANSVILSSEYADKLLLAGTPDRIDKAPVGTGPYRLKEYRDNQFIRYVRHDAYWKGPARTGQLIFDIIPRSAKRLTKLLTGECDVMSYPAASQIGVIQSHPELSLSVQSGMNVAFVALNTRQPPLNDVRVRQALSLAINRDNLLHAVYYDTGEPARSLLPPLSWGFDPAQPPVRRDVAAAKQLLKEAGMAKGFEMRLLAPVGSRSYNPDPLKTAQLIRNDLALIGVKVKIQKLEQSVLDHAIDNGRYDAVLGGWQADNNDPDNFFRQLLGCQAIASGSNMSRWCSPSFEQLLDDAVSTQQLGFRIRNYYYAQKVLAQEVPLIPLAHALQTQASRYDIQGVQMNPLGGTLFNGAYQE
ncbi:ABC transporter substrate-binding protein SapA [Aeromonas diversa]|uniref:Peptide ABC transporter substrate-binding protein n=1 Tax=Aeromonas diversa CDC 2478-85 TaxID=1268237 RepID=N9V5E2_9GAMM|nr:ABC transporter substrate-binding protein SapA [Aeromonas diversa]ENY70547.1 peptide ABC transporter substrate-binding protein [Aeromonas diversa CDC 2478-85]